MSEDTAFTPSSFGPGAIRPAELAAYLAARLCHDFISPASAIVSGLDLLDDPAAQDMREEAMGLIATSARKLADMLSFARVAFGASASAETFDPSSEFQLKDWVPIHIGGLDLSINKITDAGAIALARSPHLGQLCWLRLGNNPGISPAGHAALRERFGDRV